LTSLFALPAPTRRVWQRYGEFTYETSNGRRNFTYAFLLATQSTRSFGSGTMRATQVRLRRDDRDAYGVYALLHMWKAADVA